MIEEGLMAHVLWLKKNQLFRYSIKYVLCSHSIIKESVDKVIEAEVCQLKMTVQADARISLKVRQSGLSCL